MYIKYLTKNDLLGFLKDEYKYSTVKPIRFYRDSVQDLAALEIYFYNLRGDVFKCKAIFSDFKCYVNELVSGRSIKVFDTKFVDWVAGTFKFRENMGDNRISSDEYKASYDEYNQAVKSKRTTKPKQTENEVAKVG